MSQAKHMISTTPDFSVTNFDLPSLHVLHEEILVTLKDTETHLSEFNDDSEQAPLLLDSIDVLTQLSRIFELIALSGGQMLSAAISNGLQQLYDTGNNTDDELIMDLSEAIMILNRYVEFVLLTEMVEPEILLPIINKLRSYGTQEAISADYFAQYNRGNVTIANPEKNFQPLNALNLDTEMLTRAYRNGFMVALTHQEDDVISNATQQKLDAMSAACALIAAHTNTLFWQAASSAVTDIASILPLTLSQKHTLIYLEQQFHTYLPVMDNRFADLVSFACERDHDQARALCELYADNKLEDSQREQLQRFLSGPNRQVTDILNDLIQAQINDIKEQADSYARDVSSNTIALQSAQMATQLTELTSTLRLLGLSTSSDELQLAADEVIKWQDPSPSDFDHLLLALMSAENAAITMTKMHTPGAAKLLISNHNISLHQLDTAYDTLIKESRHSITNIEQALSDYSTDAERDISKIENTSEVIRQISGAVRFLRLPSSASMLSQLATFLQQHLDFGLPIDNKILDLIADVIMSVDYHLESLERNRPISKQALDVGQHSLSQLLVA